MKRALILVLILMSACKQQNEEPIIQFDQVTHFSIQMEDQDLYELASQDTMSALEQFKVDILLNNKFEKLSDTLFIKDLLEIGFVNPACPLLLVTT